MDTNAVYQKTPKGEDEIKTRNAKLPQKQRTMLILIDGTKTFAQLQAISQRLGITEDYLGALEAQGLIARIGGAAASVGAEGPKDEVQRFSAAQRFMNDTVVNALGMRAFFLTLKIEKCSSRGELAELLDDYAKAITKGQGAESAAVLTDQARELLG